MNQFEELKKQVEKFDIVSFDIFGTLLINPFHNDESAYKYISKYIGDSEYYKQRIEAQKQERIAKLIRNKKFEEIKLCDIYERMEKKFHPTQEVEKEFLLTTLYPNKLIIELFNYAIKLNKIVIIISDTFYDEEFIRELLSNNSINGYQKIYLSSNYGKTKASGTLFQLVINDLNTNANKIIHFGDNKISDIERAKSNGINAKNIDRFANSMIKYAPLKLPQIGNSDNYWIELGYCLGGFLALAFVQNVIKIAEKKGINDILFVARDGFVLKKVFDLINTNKDLSAKYVYASRHLKKMYCDDYEKNHSEYENYINNLNLKSSDKICIVDTATANYSAESLLKKYIVNSPLTGIYLTSTKVNSEQIINLITIDKPYAKFNWDFIELLIASTEYPITKIYSASPVYDSTPNIIEQKRKAIYENILKGEINFVEDYLEIFKKFQICLSVDYAIQSISDFWNNLTEIDKSYLSNIKHAVDPENTLYFDILSSKEQKVKIFIKKDLSQIRKRLLQKKQSTLI